MAKEVYLKIYRSKSTTTLLAQLICIVKNIATILSHINLFDMYIVEI